MVSIHALTRRATPDPRNGQVYKVVSIHALTRRATEKQCDNFKPKCFNPRPHAEGDQVHFSKQKGGCSFNPRPHAEGDEVCLVVDREIRVSIHALTRRATMEEVAMDYDLIVSIHALTRRATFTLICCRDFSVVSIHALTRRATTQV